MPCLKCRFNFSLVCSKLIREYCCDTSAIYFYASIICFVLACPQVQKLISYVREAFKEYVLRTLWIDGTTRIKAAQKVCDNVACCK